jgi:N-acetylglucosamine transport system permease protein
MKLKRQVPTSEKLYKAFIYLVLIVLAIIILIPVAWAFMASVKETSEHYANPWNLPTHIHWQNFIDAWNKANMSGYMFNSVFVTGLALVILLVVALPASYCLARFQFTGRKLISTCFMAGLFVNVNYIVVPI